MSRIQSLLLYGLIYPGSVVAVVAALSVAIRGRGRTWPTLLKFATVLGVVMTVVRIIFVMNSPVWGFDHKIFLKVGLDVLSGVDPYGPAVFDSHPFLHPPSSFPLFAAFALLPAGMSLVIRTLADSAIALILVELSRRVLASQGRDPFEGSAWYERGALAAAFALSDACTATLELGQLALLAAFFILCALAAQAKGRGVMAGVFLAFATIKIGTMLPFLLLFNRRSDRSTWIALSVTVLILCLVNGHPGRLPDQCRSMLHSIAKLSAPGAVNDVSYAGPENVSVIGFEHALYRVGIRDRSALALLQYAAIGLIGAGLARLAWREDTPRGLLISLVSLFSVLFLYHRSYDAVIFALPLTYAVGEARSARGRRRILLVAAAVSMLLVLYAKRKLLKSLTTGMPEWGAVGRLVELLVLPCMTWFTLAAMLLLWIAGRPTRHEVPITS